MINLWTELYRPTQLNDYAFKDADQRKQVESWVAAESIPHLLFSGSPGVGKTTLAKILIGLLHIDPYDVLEINASRENSVDTIRNKIINFIQTMPFGKFKVVLLDEADYITPNGQAALRGVMETYHASARFILTCNYPHRVIPALHSRCQGFHIDRIDTTEFTYRIASILLTEKVEFDVADLDTYVKATYPDMRKCLNLCQMNTDTDVDTQKRRLIAPKDIAAGGSEWRVKVVELFKAKRPIEARKLLCSSARPDEIDEIYRWMYDNLDLWSDDVHKQDQAILIIRDGLANQSLVADQEINLSATIIKLCSINNP